ncbi:hypothetical protein Q0F99_07045 [Rathayibacter oskolensis]|uniref:hypothetical protein n=1 Tax=Rathayibacter oskolensis TaxID=1891671 RepID=UPI00265E9435|nr:hypothetical protein [Rathayibacter oskolensis]WKK72680.1 hypothetical protein Q0F99_07045 [Rathayibacter oskolensis]
MSTTASETLLPATALVLPLLLGVSLLVGGVAGLLPPGRPGGPLLPWLRIAVGAALILSDGEAFIVAAFAAVLLCSAALAAAFGSYGRAAEAPTGAARLAGAAALATVAAISAVEGLLGFDGVTAHFSRFDLRDLSWAAALVGVLAVSSLLQLAAVRPAPRSRLDPADGELGSSP